MRGKEQTRSNEPHAVSADKRFAGVVVAHVKSESALAASSDIVFIFLNKTPITSSLDQKPRICRIYAAKIDIKTLQKSTYSLTARARYVPSGLRLQPTSGNE